MLDDFGIEIGTSFGPLHGRVWRIGTMGYNARKDAVLTTLAALEAVLRRSGGVAAAQGGARVMTTAREVLDRCAELDRFTATPPQLERVYLSREHASANAVAAGGWSRPGCAPGRTPRATSAAGREGPTPGMPALLLGSHLDTVPDAGSYDGMLGVVMAIAVAERLRDRDLPFALEVIGFSDEEGTRFGKALLGSQAFAGVWEEDWWDLRDRDGVTLHEAFVDFGLDPREVGSAARTA